MAEQEHWQWQEPGTAWKGAGLYHVTLTVTDRHPLLGELITTDGNPARARVVRTALGDALVDSLMSITRHHTEVQVLHFCLMPDHLHAVLYVRRTMAKGIRTVVRGFWQAAKKLGRACSKTGASRILFGRNSKKGTEGWRKQQHPCAGKWARILISDWSRFSERCLLSARWPATASCKTLSAIWT